MARLKVVTLIPMLEVRLKPEKSAICPAPLVKRTFASLPAVVSLIVTAPRSAISSASMVMVLEFTTVVLWILVISVPVRLLPPSRRVSVPVPPSTRPFCNVAKIRPISSVPAPPRMVLPDPVVLVTLIRSLSLPPSISSTVVEKFDVMVSLPSPPRQTPPVLNPVMLSLPAPPSNVDVPLEAVIVSLPAPPSIESLPVEPLSESLPSEPMIVSFAAPPS